MSWSYFEGSTNFLLPVVRETWILDNFRTYGSSFGSKNCFHPPFNLITKSILNIDPLIFIKTDAVSEFAKIGRSLPFLDLSKGSFSLFGKLGWGQAPPPHFLPHIYAYVSPVSALVIMALTSFFIMYNY